MLEIACMDETHAVLQKKEEHLETGSLRQVCKFNIPAQGETKEEKLMAFFNSAVNVLQTLVVALGAGLGIWGAINLLEGYGNDNPGANAHVR